MRVGKTRSQSGTSSWVHNTHHVLNLSGLYVLDALGTKKDVKDDAVKLWIHWGELLFTQGVSGAATKLWEGLVGEGGWYRHSEVTWRRCCGTTLNGKWRLEGL